jgi:hypothetical protein
MIAGWLADRILPSLPKSLTIEIDGGCWEM